MPSPIVNKALYLWLTPFLHALEQKGMYFGPDVRLQVLHVLEAYAGKITNDEDLLNYIAPLLAKNQEDQLVIRKEFHAHFPPAATVKETAGKSPLPEWIFLAALFLLILEGIAVYYIGKKPVYLRSSFEVQATSVNEPVTITAVGLENISDTAYTRFVWKYGDGVTDTTTGVSTRHQYGQPGKYPISLHLLPRVFEKNIRFPAKDTIQSIMICKPAFTIESETGATAEINQTVRFYALYDSLYPPSGMNTWEVNGVVVQRNQRSFTYTFNKPGVQTITYTDARYTAGTSCDSLAETTVTIQPAAQRGFIIHKENDPTQLPDYVNPWIIGVTLVLLALSAWLFLKARNRGALVPENSDAILKNMKGRGPPYEIPFNDTNRFITDETLINRVAESWKQRFAGEGFTLDIKKTIANIARSGGQIIPAWSQRTFAAEYLVLIDRSINNDQHVKLAGYLLRRFSRSDIFIREFYFSDHPEECTNSEFPQGISISRLYDLYPDHVLLVFSDGKPLLRDFYPVTNEAIVKPLERWPRRALITPAPFSDWSAREQALQENFLVLPSDLGGLLLLFTLTEAPDIHDQKYNRGISDSNGIAGVNFTKIEEIKAYLNHDPFLFQWLCASAIYPSVNWNVFLGIGEALRHQQYINDIVSYSGLLKLVRISWMKEGIMPDWIRLELLKELEPVNEKIAREALVDLLEDAVTNLNGGKSHVSKRIQLQLITDKFLLFAHAPLHPNYERFKEAYAQFKTLWQDKQVTIDPVLEVYLKKEGKWSTLVGNSTLSDKASASEAVDSFFNKETATKARNLSATRIASSGFAVVLVLLLAGLLLWKAEIKGTKADKLLHIVQEDKVALIPFTIRFSIAGYPETARLRADSVSFWLYFQQNDSVKVGIKDTVITRQLPYRWIGGKNIRLKILNKRNSYRPGTIYLQKNNVAIKIIRDKNSCLFQSQFIDLQLQNDLSGQWFDPRNNRSPVMTYSRGKLNGDTVLFYLRCDQDSEKFKVITFNFYRGHMVYYLSRIDSLGRLGYYKDLRSYATKNEALSQQENPALRLLSSSPASAAAELPAELPLSAAEIWRNGNSEMMSIDLVKRKIYYTSGDKNNYETYVIRKVTVKDGVYRVISSTGRNAYKLMFLKSLSSQALAVSLCPGSYLTAAEAEKLEPAVCRPLLPMTTYYSGNRANAIYLAPGGQGRVSAKSQKAFKSIFKPGMTYQSGTIEIHLNRIDSLNEKSDQEQIETMFYQTSGAYLKDENHKLEFAFVMHPYFNGTPFDRSYIEYTVGTEIPALYGNVQFEFDSFAIKTSSYLLLDKLSSEMRSNMGLSIELAGHTSSEGTTAYNLRYSQDMASSIKTYLVNTGINASRITVKGYGESKPIASNNTEAGRTLNRRVEIYVKYKSK